jgi:hypothetical protein
MSLLSQALVDVAEQAKLYDVTEHAVRGGRRRRRMARVAPVAAVVVVMIGLVTVVGPWRGGPDRQVAEPSAGFAQLLKAPTRGPLASDTTYIAAMRDKALRDMPVDGRIRSDLARNPAKLRLLYAGDMPDDSRLAVFGALTPDPTVVRFTGPAGAPVDRMKMADSLIVPGGPVYATREGNLPPGRGYVLALGPAGYQVEVSSKPRYLADGTVERTWTRKPAGYLLQDLADVPAGLRMRFVRDSGEVLYEGDIMPPTDRRRVTVDSAPRAGKPVPAASDEVAQSLAYGTGLTSPDIRYKVLWSDDFTVHDPNGRGSGTGKIVTVMAATPDGGGPYLTMASDAGNPATFHRHPTGAGILGDPEHSLITMRLPAWDKLTDDLQILAPTTAVRAEVIGGGGVIGTATLDRGVGRLTLASPAAVTVRAYDSAGKVVAERQFSDKIDDRGDGMYEPEIRSW